MPRMPRVIVEDLKVGVKKAQPRAHGEKAKSQTRRLKSIPSERKREDNEIARPKSKPISTEQILKSNSSKQRPKGRLNEGYESSELEEPNLTPATGRPPWTPGEPNLNIEENPSLETLVPTVLPEEEKIPSKSEPEKPKEPNNSFEEAYRTLKEKGRNLLNSFPFTMLPKGSPLPPGTKVHGPTPSQCGVVRENLLGNKFIGPELKFDQKHVLDLDFVGNMEFSVINTRPHQPLSSEYIRKHILKVKPGFGCDYQKGRKVILPTKFDGPFFVERTMEKKRQVTLV